MTVHFPIVFVVVTVILKMIMFVVPTIYLKHLRTYYYVNLGLAIVSLGISLFTGELALDEVRASLTQVQVAYDHERWAEISLQLFLFAGAMEYLAFWNFNKKFVKWRVWLSVLSSLLVLSGSVAMGVSAYYGGHLVYEQGAGVQRVKSFPPSP